ncbi:MAG: helix-turn-helix domain-containing protein [Verrucomicrobiia bacterium]
MLNRNYLRLQLNRLRKAEEWVDNGLGLTFVFVSRGAGQYSVGSVARAFGRGDVVVMPGDVNGKLSVSSGEEIVFWSFSAELEHFFPLFADDEIWLLQDLKNRLKTARFYPASSSVAADSHRLISGAPTHYNLAHRSQLLKVAAIIFGVELDALRPKNTAFVPIEEHLKEVLEKLSITDLLGLSVKDLANRFSCSRRHLNRLFHEHLGLSVSGLRMELRLLRAATLLRDSTAKVSSVAEQCGFNHLGLFNTCFKRRFGVSPGNYRRDPETPETVGPRAKTGLSKCQLASNGLCPWLQEGAMAGDRAEEGNGKSDIAARLRSIIPIQTKSGTLASGPKVALRGKSLKP